MHCAPFCPRFARFPLTVMEIRGWISLPPSLRSQEPCVDAYIVEQDPPSFSRMPLFESIEIEHGTHFSGSSLSPRLSRC